MSIRPPAARADTCSGAVVLLIQFMYYCGGGERCKKHAIPLQKRVIKLKPGQNGMLPFELGRGSQKVSVESG